MEGLYSYFEDCIRKTLLFIPDVDVARLREKHMYEKEYEELTDDKIRNIQIIEVTLDNCKFSEVENNEESNIEDKDSLGGFTIAHNLAEMSKGKPLSER